MDIFRPDLAQMILSHKKTEKAKEERYKHRKYKAAYLNEIVSIIINENRCAVTHFLCKDNARHQFEVKTLLGGELVRVLAEYNYKRNVIFVIEDNYNTKEKYERVFKCQGIQSVIIELLAVRQLHYLVHRSECEHKQQHQIERFMHTKHKFNNQLERDSFTAVHEAIKTSFGWTGSFYKNRHQYE